MKMETIKSFILIVLVTISLLLTLALWNDSPRYEKLYKSSYVSEVSVGGQALKKKDLIEPHQVIFRNKDNLFGFSDPGKEKDFYVDMGFWALNRFSAGEVSRKKDPQYQIEVIYPAPVPMKLLNSLFVMDHEVFLPAWSFKRIYVSFDQAETTLKLKFLSADGAYEANATISDAGKYKQLWSYFTQENKGLVSYMKFNNAKGKQPIYIQSEARTMTRRSLSAQPLEERKFVNALFKEPSLVSKNAGEAYTDGQRGMRILQERRSMEYINPIQTNKEIMDPTELIEKSTANINEHKGWTSDFNYFEIDSRTNTVRYKMYYKGYEIFNSSGLATIEQQWRNQELYKYRRPLFDLSNSLGGDEVTLPSGKAFVQMLKSSKAYDINKIQDVRIGYHLDFPVSDAHSVTLEPAWYILYRGNWQQVDVSSINGEEGETT